MNKIHLKKEILKGPPTKRTVFFYTDSTWWLIRHFQVSANTSKSKIS